MIYRTGKKNEEEKTKEEYYIGNIWELGLFAVVPMLVESQ